MIILVTCNIPLHLKPFLWFFLGLSHKLHLFVPVFILQFFTYYKFKRMFFLFKKKNIIVYFSSQEETAVITKLNCFTVLHQTNPLNKRSELATNYGGGGLMQTREKGLCTQSQAGWLRPPWISLNFVLIAAVGSVWWSLWAWNLSNCSIYNFLSDISYMCVLI